MKIYNIKLHSILPILFVILVLIVLVVTIIIPSQKIIMTNENFIQILRDVHDNPYKYEDKTIEMSGYIFRATDFSENQFVVARDMIIDENDARIIGFLCEYENIKEFENNEWIKVSGRITIGDYHGIMPIIQITHLKIIKNCTEREIPIVQFDLN